jgi:putative transposon-encoded protein
MEYLTDHVTTQGLGVEGSASSEELEILFERRVKLMCNENILTVPLKYYDVTVAVLMVSRV